MALRRCNPARLYVNKAIVFTRMLLPMPDR